MTFTKEERRTVYMKIEVNKIRKVYTKGKIALSDIDIDISSPAFIGLLGPNGAGKSTLMKLLTLNLLPSSGKILIDGEPIQDREKWLKSRLGYLPQEYGLYEELTVYQFLDYISALKGITKNTADCIEKVLSFCNLQEKRKSRIGTLSGGFKQRVAIAQALLGTPEIIILDEPTVGLDPEERLSFRNKFSETARDKVVILSTHIIEDIQSVCNRLIVLWGGRILFDGLPEELINRADGHVGTYECTPGKGELGDDGKYRITSKVVTKDNIAYKMVAEILPDFAVPVKPSLEDAYIYICSQEETSL
jgi:ABC-type multidrug transport system ATPase subunit